MKHAVIVQYCMPETMGGAIVNELVLSRHATVEQALEFLEHWVRGNGDWEDEDTAADQWLLVNDLRVKFATYFDFYLVQNYIYRETA